MSVARLCKGALAGSIATGPMTVVMLLIYHLLPRPERLLPHPPELITRRMLGDQAPGGRDTPRWLIWVLHFGYGGGAGAVYAPLARRLPLPPVLRGVAFGLGVWFVSYMGWLPAVDILPPAHKHPTRRNVMMISAHIVWGAVLDLVLTRLGQEDASAEDWADWEDWDAGPAAFDQETTPAEAAAQADRVEE